MDHITTDTVPLIVESGALSTEYVVRIDELTGAVVLTQAPPSGDM